MILQPMPKAVKDIKQLADTLYERMVGREEEAVEKIRKVIEFATDDDCMSVYLTSIILLPDVDLGRHVSRTGGVLRRS